jgi:hypothetical protein
MPRKNTPKRKQMLQRRIPRSLGVGFPARYRTTLKYSNFLNAAAAVSDVKQLYLSNCKNPDPSYGTAYTPYVTNLLGTGGGGAGGTGIYNKYIVTSVRARMCFANLNTRYVQMVMLATNDSSSSSLLPITATGREFSTPLKLVNPVGSSNPSLTLDRTYKMHTIMGVSQEAYMGESDYHGTTSGFPLEMVYLFCYLYSLDGTTNISGTFSYELEFDVEFYDKQLEEE